MNEKDMEIELAAHMRRMLNVDERGMTFEMEFVDEIPLDKSGKLKKVISEIKG